MSTDGSSIDGKYAQSLSDGYKHLPTLRSFLVGLACATEVELWASLEV